MILVFPDPDTFRLALSGGFVPADVTAGPANVSTDPAGRLFVETNAKLPKKAAADLAKVGVTGTKRHPAEPQQVSSWVQIVPAEPDPAPPNLPAQAPVLFELPTAAELPALVNEMLRLGNDRQSFRWVGGPADAPARVLLKVLGPPYYSLLRALDKTAGPAAVRAYAEILPRVWVQVGYRHPLAAQVRPADGQLVLIRPNRDWQTLPDEPFRDVYDLLQFAVPASPVAWADAAIPGKLAVPLRLTAGNAADQPDLWVLRGDAADRLDGFVRDADERVLGRLRFAVGTGVAGSSLVVVRTIASKLAPPVLAIEGAVGYRPFSRLPNLYVPAGTRLHPTLRRDAVRKLLADDPDRVVWLAPGPDGAFTPETLPEDSFRPLEDWVEYVIAANADALSAWVGASRFEFESFVCSDTTAPKPKEPDKPPKGRKGGRGTADDTPASAPTGKPAAKPADAAPAAAAPFAAEVVTKPPGEWEVRRRELEGAFLSIDGPLDAPERRILWPELAAAAAGAGDPAEAGLCWANAAWDDGEPPAGWPDAWVRAEIPDLPRPITAAALDALMAPADPTPAQARQFAVALLGALHQLPAPASLSGKLPAAQQYFQRFEGRLPVRLSWLVNSRLAGVGGGDVLGLARSRDRLLQRLLEDGLNPERNLPFFLRSAGARDADRVRRVRDGFVGLHRVVRAWAESGGRAAKDLAPSDGGATAGYVDLLFGWGLAKLGEATAANELVAAARDRLTAGKPADTASIAGKLLFEAYRTRVEQALAGKPLTGRLPQAWYDELGVLRGASTGVTNSPARLAAYAIDRLREQSRVLEPSEKPDPLREWMAEYQGGVAQALAALDKERDPDLFGRKARELLKANPGSRLLVLSDVLPMAPRAGETFTAEMLALVPAVLREPPAAGPAVSDTTKKQGRLLERALFLAGHFDRREMVQQFADLFVDLVHGRPEQERYDLINEASKQGVRSLRKLGLSDDSDRMLSKLRDEVLQGKTTAQLKAKSAARPDVWANALQTLVNIAGGWLSFGLLDRATPVLDDARADLLAAGPAKLPPKDYTALARAYVAAAGQGPAADALLRITELFGKSDPGRVTNTMTTAACYSLLHLRLAEEVVFAVAGDEFALGPAGRRWLEEDEYLIRRRVHADVKRAVGGSGL